MKDKDFKGTLAGLEDAIGFVRGDTTKGRVATGQPAPAEAKLAEGQREGQGDPRQDHAQPGRVADGP